MNSEDNNDKVLALSRQLHKQIHQATLTAIEINIVAAEDAGAPGFSPTTIIGTLVAMVMEVVEHTENVMEDIEKEHEND